MRKCTGALIACAVVVLAATPGHAQQKRKAAGDASPAMTAISPIFSELVAFTLPAGFKTVHEKAGEASYVREAVPAGETAQGWSEMVTVTGVRGAAADANLTPKGFVERIGGGFQRACPDTFRGTFLGAMAIDGHDGYAAIVSCGRSPSGPFSESALIVAIRGSADYYTVQHAERVPAARAGRLDDKRWGARLKALGPIRVCPIVAGEAAPYPSCVGPR